ncbi:drug resistance transporter, EmrB/QacA subfamily [Quadrisphaera granulorum]|uniref:EmrB/QacA subfamily drug resistance transporter n=1 Tax=Quadrisphaera granulorum TaxID=317664 RepID=A0A316ACR3_9ACTN|nr:MDR family MFS transporter [Quadrisphaera granulorum]PWJ55431.1 EmrB/QacA subfamily drug resistance transporter [Quadrisphaera granulorum]SZE95495.1 drug resistance transporter, EmrB/QacA subfamily [Quadrisphaera granulorum]
MSSTAAAPPAASAPEGAFTHRQIMTILSGLLLGMFLAALDQTVVSTAIRTIADDLQGYSLQAWATTAFLITSTITTPLYGKLSDTYGRKPFYLFAIGVFIIGSVACAFAWSMYSLAAFRALQGIGAGGLMSLAFAILGDIVPPRERSRYQAFFMAVFGSSSVLGPVLGGLFAGQEQLLGMAGWRWIFFINVPFGVAAFAVVMRYLHIPHVRRDHRIDWWGAAALILALVPMLIVAEQGREWGWGSTDAITCYVLAVVGIAAFIVAERVMGDAALLPPRMFRERTFSVGIVSSFIVGMGMFGGMLLLPQYLQVVKGSSPTVAGLQTLPLMLGIMSAAAVSGRITSKTGRYKIFPVVGTAVLAVALVLFSLVGADTPLAVTMAIMLLFGMGLGLNMQSVILAVQNAVSPRDMGVATSSVTFFRQMGGTLGAAVFLSLLFSLMLGRIATAFTEAQGTPEFQQALAANPDQAQTLAGVTSGGGSLNDTSFLNGLDATLAHPFRVGFSSAMDSIFLLAAAIMVIGFVVTIFLPEKPLRNTAGVQARAEEDAAPAAAGGPAAGVAASAPTSTTPVVEDDDDERVGASR